MIRITGGEARGRVIKAKIPSGVRPSSARVREALFSMVGQDLSGMSFLDAFGGSGVMGFEAWSRGAQVTIVEKNHTTAAWVREQQLGLGADLNIRTGDVLFLASRLGVFDGVFADPPYDVDPMTVLPSLAVVVGDWLVYESEKRTEVPEVISGLKRVRHRVFGRCRITIYERDGARESTA